MYPQNVFDLLLPVSSDGFAIPLSSHIGIIKK